MSKHSQSIQMKLVKLKILSTLLMLTRGGLLFAGDADLKSSKDACMRH